jgi:altronate dehydratase
VECVTSQAGAGADIVPFATRLGTPTGSTIAPVVKLSTNAALGQRMRDVIDSGARLGRFHTLEARRISFRSDGEVRRLIPQNCEVRLICRL